MTVRPEATETPTPAESRRIRTALAAVGLNAASLARLIGVSSSHLVRVLSGRRHPSSKLATALEEQLGAEVLGFARGEVTELVVRSPR